MGLSAISHASVGKSANGVLTRVQVISAASSRTQFEIRVVKILAFAPLPIEPEEFYEFFLMLLTRGTTNLPRDKRSTSEFLA